jgi:hypothetical protein
MNKPSKLSLILSGLLALVLLGGFVTPVSANAQHPRQTKVKHGSNSSLHHFRNSGKILTYLTIKDPADTNLGDPFTLTGVIKDQSGKPISDKAILFTINDEYLGQARSNDEGVFERKITKVLNAGTYKIKATSNATRSLDTSVAYANLKILPAEVRVQTIPPISGIPFQMDGKRFVSGDDGFATVTIDAPGEYRLQVLAEQYQNPDKRIEFARWLEESYQPYQDVTVPTDKVIQAGFNVYHLVGQSFVDLDSVPVDPARISEFTIRSAQGDMFVLHDGEPRWIPASRVARRAFGLEETQLLYSVLTVTVDGSNVVNQSQQKFFTYPVENWPISLLLYSLRINAKDGLFGNPVGKSVNVQFPDGRIQNYPLDKSGSVEIRSLARGNYFVELVGTYGMSNKTPVALSRNQDVNTKVITYLDITVVALMGAILAAGLFLYGRPSILNLVWRKKAQAVAGPEPEWGLLPQAYSETLAELHDYRNMRYETVKMLDDRDFHTATGVERDLFEKMLRLYENDLRKSGRKTKLSGADQILLTLVYLREHRKEYEIAPVYGVSEGTVRRSVKRVKSVLMKSAELDHSELSVLQAEDPHNHIIMLEPGETLNEE